ncbi:metal ABC transporter permease [Tuwongella immobilis]|uniref:Uncharacterized protein n=1 Tax=Tuwongella immobilis TaxID=692036 RepID=A0A6C2YMS0_9BACT|nr:metal ABC transporter permease [Tuwongella immobilis]VIP02365.1 iron abc transporter : Iron ABC transporter OS=Sporocytophaga myxococcoides GN=MYP_4044 PE=4 SV=1: ABC-3 [Tuwongella immobilis]VTS01181.1 iron abc transporter : Iron ABC transporter OS=Sporocytophaga myxococcoides GN=MYP_4044 PE=4 SV=1: ABC-3 [Tuwongella immobilis]
MLTLTMAWIVLTAILAAVACSLVGCFLVLRRLSLMGDAIAHAVLPGIAIAYWLTGSRGGMSVMLGAMAMGVLTTFTTLMLQRTGRVNEDAGLGVVFTSFFALGVLLITRIADQIDLDPGCVLYGELELVTLEMIPVLGIPMPRAFLVLAIATLVVLVALMLLGKELTLAAFDPAYATAIGFSAGMLHYFLMTLVAGVTVAAFETVGSILVVAMLVVPATTAQLVAKRMRTMLLAAAGFGTLAAILGVTAAYWLDTNAAGSIATASGVIFAGVLGITRIPGRGIRHIVNPSDKSAAG